MVCHRGNGNCIRYVMSQSHDNLEELKRCRTREAARAHLKTRQRVTGYYSVLAVFPFTLAYTSTILILSQHCAGIMQVPDLPA